MPTTCEHCGEPIALDDTLGDWFHTGRDSSDIDMLCDPRFPFDTSINVATPRVGA